jgi:chlorobactene glucosyltransferase
MVLLHIAIVAALGVILVTVAGNLVYFRALERRAMAPSDPPLVSVLVPARNEAARLGACLEALAALSWKQLEVVVLDDCSDDATAIVAHGFEGRIAGLRVLDGSPLPDGWIGKSHACDQLARAARGDWLLFIDADVTLERGAIERALALAEGNRADLLTALPRQRMETFGERLVIPFLYFTVAGLLPMFALAWLRSARLAAASGQFMLFRRGAYDLVGGHEAVRSNIVEDVALARAVRREGLRLAIANGVRLGSCRMYDGWRDLADGFAKNGYALVGGSIAGLVTAVSIGLLLFVAPAVLLVVAAVTGGPVAFPAVEVALALAARVLLALAFREPVWIALLHPMAACAAVAIVVRSFARQRRGGVAWRGRRYG